MKIRLESRNEKGAPQDSEEPKNRIEKKTIPFRRVRKRVVIFSLVEARSSSACRKEEQDVFPHPLAG